MKLVSKAKAFIHADYGHITNFGKAHLEGFGSEEGVIKGKSELYDYLISNSSSFIILGFFFMSNFY